MELCENEEGSKCDKPKIKQFVKQILEAPWSYESIKILDIRGNVRNAFNFYHFWFSVTSDHLWVILIQRWKSFQLRKPKISQYTTLS